MPLLPFATCGDIPTPDAGCSFLYDTGQAILAAALTGLEPFIPPDSCGQSCDAFVSMGPPVAEFCDALSIHLLSYGPTGQRVFPSECADGAYPQQVAKWQVQLWENCYPGATTEGGPSVELLDHVNEHVYAHGIATYVAVVSGWADKSIVLPPQVTSLTFGDLTPLGPQGLAVGWKFDVAAVVG